MIVRILVFVAGTLATVFVILLALLTQPFVRAVLSDPPRVDPLRLEAHVKRLSVDFYPRSYDQHRQTEQAADYIADEFKRAGAELEVQEFVVAETTYRNVIARFGPSSGPLLVIGAHYDSRSAPVRGTSDGRGYSPATHTPGADDNASGVAALIELARLLGREPPSRTVELVAYALEEPLQFRDEIGSVWHARRLVAEKRDVRLMLSLEMLGYFRDEPGSQRYPVAGLRYLYPDRGNFIALVGRFGDFAVTRGVKGLMSGATDLPVHSLNAPPAVPGVDRSDHRSFWDAGLPALMVTDTAFLRNPNYHRAGDTYDTLDYARMAKVVQGVYAVAQRF